MDIIQTQLFIQYQTNSNKTINSIWGLKAGVWIGGTSGLNLLFEFNIKTKASFYSQKNMKNTVRFRPEIGFGFGVLTNKDFDGMNKHNFVLNIMIDLKKLNKNYRNGIQHLL